MAVATSGSGRNTSSAGGPNSTLWTLVLGAALVRLVTAKRRAPFAEVMVGRRRSSGGRGASKSARSYTDGEAEEKEVTERDRGRAADKPSEIPAKGWKDVLWRVYEEMNKDRVLAVAAGCTFYSLLAIFPGIAALVSLYGLFADAGTINQHLATLGGFLPGGALDIIGEQVKRIASKPGIARLCLLLRPRDRAVERQRRHEGALRRAQHRLRRGGEAQLHQAQPAQSLMFTARRAAVSAARDRRRRRDPRRAEAVLVRQGARMADVALAALAAALPRGRLFGLACLYRYGPSRDSRSGAGSVPGAAPSPASSGSPPRCCSPGTSRISATTTRPTARSARPSAS
jgi:membrane protein